MRRISEEVIESHPFLKLAPELREKDRKLRDDFIDKLMKHLFVSMPDPEKASVIEDHRTQTSDQMHYSAMHHVLADDKSSFRVIDNVTFTLVCNATFKSYDRSLGPFLNYFRSAYCRSLRPNASDLTRTAGKRDDRIYKIIKKIRAYWGKTTLLSFENVTDEQILELATALGEEPGVITEAIFYWAYANNPISLDDTIDADDETTLGSQIESDEHDYEDLEDTMAIAAFLRKYLNFEEQEYPRLFLSNGLLHASKEEQLKPLILEMKREEEYYLHDVFLRDYLEFVLHQPPEPDSIWNILLAKADYPFQDQTIAEYKGVSRPAVSAQRKKYRLLYEARRAKFLQEQKDE